MRHAVKDLEGELLNVAVAMAEHGEVYFGKADPARWEMAANHPPRWWCRNGEPVRRYSDDWAYGGLLVERNDYLLPYRTPPHRRHLGRYSSATPAGFEYSGDTPLVAAMRALVATAFGPEIDLPE